MLERLSCLPVELPAAAVVNLTAADAADAADAAAAAGELEHIQHY